MSKLPFDQTSEAVSALMRRATRLKRAWQAILLISDPGYARTEARDGERWAKAVRVLEDEGIQPPDSSMLTWI